MNYTLKKYIYFFLFIYSVNFTENFILTVKNKNCMQCIITS